MDEARLQHCAPNCRKPGCINRHSQSIATTNEVGLLAQPWPQYRGQVYFNSTDFGSTELQRCRATRAQPSPMGPRAH